MPEMVSKCEHKYNGRALSKGERFDAEPRFVPVLIALGRAEVAGAQEQYATREVVSAPRKKKRRGW